METSDSEYFESADEDFVSDEEDIKTVESPAESNVSKTETQFENLHLDEAKAEICNIQKENVDQSCSKKDKKDDENKATHKEEKEEIAKVECQPKWDLQCDKETERKTPVVVAEAKKIDSKVNNNDLDTSTHKPIKYVEITEIIEEMEDIKAQIDENTSTVENPEPNSEILPKTKEPKSKLGSKRAEIIEPEPKIEKVEEENLWDDAEIDWASEPNEEEPKLEEPMGEWDNDDWEPIESPKVEEVPIQEQSNSGWGAWGNWGVSSILTTASTLTQGFTTALESGIGVPNPEEMARVNKLQKEKLKESTPEREISENASFGFGNLVMGVSHLTKFVESTGTKVISGGLDTLETIGKKTMEVLQEGDPGLKKKRAFLSIDKDKPVLSQLLREAKEKADTENKLLEQKHFKKKAKNYETLFDDHQGLVHLEALEMLSRQCVIKLQTLLESYSDEALTELQETMDQVKELCELPEEDEEEHSTLEDIREKLDGAVKEINVPVTYTRLVETWEETDTWLTTLKLDLCDERELHQQAIENLAQLTAIAVEQFHKTGELLLVKEHRSTADEADSLVQLTSTLTAFIGVIVAERFTEKLQTKISTSTNKEEINGLITNVFFEAANSRSYIQDAFQLLIPVLQVGAI